MDAFQTTNFVINILSKRSLNFISPYHTLFHQIPYYIFVRSFGASCLPWLSPYASNKLQPKSIHCVFIGYNSAHKGYKCLDPKIGRVYISRHVIFNETEFPLKNLPRLSSSVSNSTSDTLWAPSASTTVFKVSATPFASPTFIIESVPTISAITSDIIISNAHQMQTRGESGIFKPKVFNTQHALSADLVSKIPESAPSCFFKKQLKF